MDTFYEFFIVDNKIKIMSGQAVSGLENLKYLYLDGNECIDQGFSKAPNALMVQIIDEKCATA